MVVVTAMTVIIMAVIVMGMGVGGVMMTVVVMMLDRIAARMARMRPEQRNQAGQDRAQQRQKDNGLDHSPVPLRMTLPANRPPLIRIMRP